MDVIRKTAILNMFLLFALGDLRIPRGFYMSRRPSAPGGPALQRRSSGPSAPGGQHSSGRSSGPSAPGGQHRSGRSRRPSAPGGQHGSGRSSGPSAPEGPSTAASEGVQLHGCTDVYYNGQCKRPRRQPGPLRRNFIWNPMNTRKRKTYF